MEARKNFLEWIRQKIRIHNNNKAPEYFAEGDVWWCAIGENVGIEINGKGKKFSRPVLILTKINGLGVMVVPLTSQHHNNSRYYTAFEFDGGISYAALSQARTISTARLYKKYGSVSDVDLRRVRQGFLRLHEDKK